MKNRAIIYGRFSDDGQQIESIETQVAKCEEYAEKHGLKVVKHYIDEGFSASTKIEKREEFNALIRDSKKDLFDIVLCHKVDRFARDSVDFLVTERELNKVGVKVIVVATPFNDDAAGVMLKQIMIAQAEFFSRNLSDEVRTKSLQHASKGKNMGGKANFGYCYDEHGNYEINPLEAHLVRQMYELYLQGYGYKAISNKLNMDGHRNRDGKLFSKNLVGAILRNEKYKGCYTYGKEISDFKTKKRFKNDAPIILEDQIPAIVSKEIWGRVEKLRKKKDGSFSRWGEKKLHDFILTGFLTCKGCGGRMRGSSHSKEHCYYRCSTRTEKGALACDAKVVRADILEDLVIDKIKNYIFTDEMIEFYTENILELLKEGNGVNIDELIQKRDEIKEAKSKLLSVYLSPKSRMSEDDYIEADNDLHDQIEALDAQIYEIQANAKISVSVDDIKEYLYNLKNEVATTEEMRALVMAVVDRVEVDTKAKSAELFFKVYTPANYVSKGANGKPNNTLYQIEGMEFERYEDGVILGVIKCKLPKAERAKYASRV
jgi:site-specific DNA recombinase